MSILSRPNHKELNEDGGNREIRNFDTRKLVDIRVETTSDTFVRDDTSPYQSVGQGQVVTNSRTSPSDDQDEPWLQEVGLRPSIIDEEWGRGKVYERVVESRTCEHG